jgi:hypothetical protein
MTETELIELAKAYVALSNAHRLAMIADMFNASSIYTSSAVGTFKGATPIIKMMREFFARYPDVNWNAVNYRYSNHSVTFQFVMTATEAGTDNHLERKGVETITFDANGIISRLAVKAS